MKLIAIASIVDDSSIIGCRIFDLDTCQIKDVSVDNIQQVLNSGKVKIKSIEVCLKGQIEFNGTKLYSTKIKDGSIQGKSYLTVINRADKYTCTVCDYKGTLNLLLIEDLWKYAVADGLSNGIIAEDKGNKYVMTIDDKESTKSSSRGLYKGQCIPNIPKLLPVLVGDHSYNDVYITYKFDGSKCVESKQKGNILKFNRNEITHNMLYEAFGHTLYGRVTRQLDIELKSDIPDIIECLKDIDVIRQIDENIKTTKKKRDNKCRVRLPKIDEETGIYLPIKSTPYGDININEDIGQKTVSSGVTAGLVQKYLKLLYVMKANIYSTINFGTNKLVLCRRTSSSGITYRVVVNTVYYTYLETVELERIYENHTEYDNVIVDGDFIQIRGLDGVYRYDMKQVYEVYNKAIVQSKRALKATMLNNDYTEVIDANGNLSDLCTEGETVIIPNNVTNVTRGSLRFKKDNKSIYFGPNIQKLAAYSISYYSNNTGIAHLIIECNEKAGINIIKSLINVNAIFNTSLLFQFNRNISPEEYCLLVYLEKDNTSIQANNVDTGGNIINASEEFTSRFFKYAIANKLKGLEMINSPLRYSINGNRATITYWDYNNFIRGYEKLLSIWKTKLKTQASPKAIEVGNKIISEIDTLWQFRLNEVRQKAGVTILD